jgi:hypothetical protein
MTSKVTYWHQFDNPDGPFLLASLRGGLAAGRAPLIPPASRMKRRRDFLAITEQLGECFGAHRKDSLAPSVRTPWLLSVE